MIGQVRSGRKEMHYWGGVLRSASRRKTKAVIEWLNTRMMFEMRAI